MAGIDGGTTGTAAVGPAETVVAAPAEDALTGAGSADPVVVGKTHFRAGRYALAEQAFRRAVETGPRDVDAWIGLGASYDRLNRFDLADRAYEQAIKASHTFNLLQARGVISVAERQAYIGRVRDLAKAACAAYMEKNGWAEPLKVPAA